MNSNSSDNNYVTIVLSKITIQLQQLYRGNQERTKMGHICVPFFINILGKNKNYFYELKLFYIRINLQKNFDISFSTDYF